MTHRLLCLGNELHGDDGFGPAVARRLAGEALPSPWQLHLGAAGMPDVLALLQDCESAIVVDAAAPAGQPGRLREWAADEVPAEAAPGGHGQGLGDALRALRALGTAWPPMRILSVEMAAVTPFRMSLSPPVEAAVEPAVARLRAWMQRPAEPGR